MFGGSPGRPGQVGVVAVVLLALAVLAPGAFAKPHAEVGPAELGGSSSTGLMVGSLSSPPADAAPGDSYVAQGSVVNTSGSELSGTVTVRLLRRDETPRVVGTVGVRVAAGSTESYETAVTLPAALPDGSYALAACTPNGGEGLLSCASARRGVEVGGEVVPATTSSERTLKAARRAAPEGCSSGAHTLSSFGDRVYPEMGNGGYTSVHSTVNLIYDAVENEFLPGTNVVLGDRATQCLTDFSVDFERKGPDSGEGPGPDMQVEAVTVNGVPATFAFVQPTYPGDPNGQDDPDPLAHEAGLVVPVGGGNSLPPACTPNSEEEPPAEGEANIGDQCPANKLVITPAEPLADGEAFDVEIRYSGRPGVHTDGDGSVEGWFLSDEPAGDGSFVTTEPVGTEAWMPLNNHPSAKPTYDFNETVTAGRTAIANGELVGFSANPPNANFAGGSTTWHWHSPEPIASYLVESSVGGYDLSERLGGDGVIYYEAQASGLTAERKTLNKAIMDTQEEIVAFQERFAGPFPFTTDGVIVGAPSASFEEEMQGKITFNGGKISESTFHHENMHQWFGDNVSESNYNETFFKEGFAQLSQYLLTAKNAAVAAGGLDTPAGEAAFEASLVSTFAANYNNTKPGATWTSAPSNPTAETLFSSAVTYRRPATAYIAVRRILGATNFADALRQIQAEYGGSSIEKSELEEVFKGWLPNQSEVCRARLGTFFGEWFDTEFAAGGEATTMKPQLTSPGLVASASGKTFYDTTGSCRETAPATTATMEGETAGGAYTDPTVTLTAAAAPGAPAVTGTTYSIDGGAPIAYAGPFTLTGTGVHTLTYYSTDAEGGIERAHIEEIAVNDPPVTTARILPAPVGGKVVGPATVVLTATDDGAGIASTEYALDGGSFQAYTGPVTVDALGDHTVAYKSTDRDGAVETAKQVSFTVVAPPTAAACTRPRLKVGVVDPFARRHGVAILRKGKAYRYAGRLTCHGKPAPRGTVITISSVVKGHVSRRPGLTVGENGKLHTLLRFNGRRTLVFAFADEFGSTQAKVRVLTRRH